MGKFCKTNTESMALDNRLNFVSPLYFVQLLTNPLQILYNSSNLERGGLGLKMGKFFQIYTKL